MDLTGRWVGAHPDANVDFLLDEWLVVPHREKIMAVRPKGDAHAI